MDVKNTFGIERTGRRGFGERPERSEEGLSGKMEFGDKRPKRVAGENQPADLKERIARFNPENENGETQNFFHRFNRKGKSQDNLVV